MRSHWIRVGPTSNDLYPYEKRRGHTETEETQGRRRCEGDMKIEVEIGVIPLETKECQGL